ncbi:VC2046/SO_2500 family protein [Colwellia sp. BRX10-3]|uniref:VC2046/SO_2500 family protein n=1 Tax=Colwellia sp. BRX10-3 TaxID=2759844 RepID=UPI001C7122FE|nr:VC2046/SO_2500 family protein [Colwellia sp. BRX10-3]
MTQDALSNDILVHELQLGEQLNESVHHARRSDFSLLLAMLTDDVRAHSQFKLPLSQTPEKNTTSEQLRKYFQLPNEAPLSLKNVEDISRYNQAGLVENHQFELLRLTNTLNPKPLAFRDDAKHISQQVMSNTSLYCQQKHQDKSLAQAQPRADFNAKAWLAAVQTTIVKAPLMEAVA